MNNELVSRETLKETIDDITWYHINPYGELVEGAHDDGDAFYKAEDIYNAIDNVGDIHDFIAKADEGTLFQLKKEIENALTKIAEREAYEEARREAMRLDDNEDTYKYRGHA